jgi:hypothetical protein
VAAASISSRLKSAARGRSSSGAGSAPASDDPAWTSEGNVFGSMGPRFASAGRLSSSVPGGWTGL